MQKRAGGLRLGVLWCTWSAAEALAVAQATDVQKRAGGLRLGVLWCTWSAAVARSGGGAGHRRAEVLRGAFLACAQLLVLMAYKVECSLFVGLCVCVRALPLELFVSTWWSFALCLSRKPSSLIGTISSGGGAGHRRAQARRRTSLGRALVHLVGCGDAGSGGGAGHRRAEARRRTSLGRALMHLVSCGGAGSGGGAGH